MREEEKPAQNCTKINKLLRMNKTEMYVDHCDINGTEIVCATMKKADSSILQLKTVMWSFRCMCQQLLTTLIVTVNWCGIVQMWAMGSLSCCIITMAKPEHKQIIFNKNCFSATCKGNISRWPWLDIQG